MDKASKKRKRVNIHTRRKQLNREYILSSDKNVEYPLCMREQCVNTFIIHNKL